ncbi:MAG: hypothetical protein AAF959_01615 [Cyanobacteria bacterium P01_D01_bin.56]
MHFVFSKFRDLLERILFGKHTSWLIRSLREKGSLNSLVLHKLYEAYLFFILMIIVAFFIGVASGRIYSEMALLICLVILPFLRQAIVKGTCMSRAVLATVGVKGTATVANTVYIARGLRRLEGWRIYLQFEMPNGSISMTDDVIVCRTLYKEIESWTVGSKVEILFNPYNPSIFFPNFPEIIDDFCLEIQ